jgi:hypothetical protein
MWPFRRRTATTSVAPVHRANPNEWRRLAPITLVQASPATTFDRGFESRLATRRSPLFVEPLGHQLTADGPSGRVAAAVVPGPPRQFVARPAVQRQTMTFDQTPDAAGRPVPASTQPTTAARIEHTTDSNPTDVYDTADTYDISDTGDTDGTDTADDDGPPETVPTLAAPTGSVQPRTTPPSLVVARDAELPPLTVAASAVQPRVSTPPVVSRAVDDDAPSTTVAHQTVEQRPTIERAAQRGASENARPDSDDDHDGHRDGAEHAVDRVERDHAAHVEDVERIDHADRSEHTDTPDGHDGLVGLVGGDAPVQRAPAGDSPAAPSARAPGRAPLALQRDAEDAVVRSGDPADVTIPSTAAPEPVSPPFDAAAPHEDTARPQTITGPGDARRSRTVLGPPISTSDAAARTTGTAQRTPLRPTSATPPSSPTGPDPARAIRQPASETRDTPADSTAPLLPGAGIPTTLTPDPLRSAVAPDAQRPDTVETPGAGPDVAVRHTEPYEPSDVDASEIAPAPISTVEQRPTLSAEWLPTVARTVLGGVDTPAHRGDHTPPTAPVPSMSTGPHAGAELTPFDTDGRKSDVATWNPGEILPTLGQPDAPSGPVQRSVPPLAPRRVVVGPPISRAAVQRASLSADAARARAGNAAHGRGSPDAGVPNRDEHDAHDADDMFDIGALPITEWPPVQRATDNSPAPPSPESASGASRAGVILDTIEPTEPSGGRATGRSDAEIEELLRTLYPPLRRRICRDLLLDRERAGYGTDIRF